EGAIREVDHSIAGNALTWTAGLRFEPVGWLQFRGSYTRAIRSPTVTEAFSPTSQGFSPIIDPCDQAFINSGPNPKVRAANCAAAGVQQPLLTSQGPADVPISFAGNPNLTNEIADSRTYGFLLRPLPRLAL